MIKENQSKETEIKFAPRMCYDRLTRVLADGKHYSRNMYICWQGIAYCLVYCVQKDFTHHLSVSSWAMYVVSVYFVRR